MILGFTGTREGMTDVQRESVAEILRVQRPVVVHHGDCIGADSQFHDSAELAIRRPRIESHPCNLPKFRAYRKADFVHPVKSPTERNKDIVKTADIMVAAPKLMHAEVRSGTWQTIRFAAGRKPLVVVWPDGTVQPWG